MDDFWAQAIWSVTPTILVGGVFWVVMRSVIRADRSERTAYSKIEAAERARLERERAVTPGAESTTALES